MAVIVEWRANRPHTVHHVPSPKFGEPGFYRETESMNAFRRNIHGQFSELLRKGQRPADRFHVQWDEEWERTVEMDNEITVNLAAKGKERPSPPLVDLPRVDHFNTKAFYYAVNYDPKKRKFL